MKMNRRYALKSLGMGAAGAFFLSPWNAPRLIADPGEIPRNFIFCYFQGAWDLQLCLDPRDPGKFSESKIKETKIELAWDRLRDTYTDGKKLQREIIQPSGSKIGFGPSMAAFAKHFDKSCVVRGISMDTVTHQVGRRYFITGKQPQGLNANGSSVATQIIAQQGDKSLIPNLVVRVETYNQGLSAFASGLKVSSVSDLLSTLKEGPQSVKNEMRALLEAYRKDAADCDPVALNEDGLLSLLRNAQVKSRSLVEQNIGTMFNFLDTRDPEMVKIKQRYSIRSLTSAEAQAAMAYQALKRGVAQSVTIELANRLDTHGEEWSTNQPEYLYNGFKALSTLVSDLETTPHPKAPGKTLLDTTTILCFSEFGRTAMLNNRDGRDHSLTNAALLIGAGVPHNKVIGATSDKGMNPEAIDPVTGRVGGNFIMTPTHVIASLMEGAGYDTSHLRVRGLPCLMRKS